ncbi:protein LONG AFTER FAR-RED 3 [Sesamum angolense]|uniref:Protein LONG AFTER FAR-RED 3 n=1 Tax=Sesamum angolense TaxID=2727404 RepID=A0AAE1X7W2_9LAMI|nr:protein LONG AFTER FAR-RED 3 [Sesamum angolense]
MRLTQSHTICDFISSYLYVTVADINPLGSIKTAVKRVPPGWTKAWIPSERISLSDALNGYTISAARSCFLDEDIGSLSPGKMADFVVLSVDSWDKFAAEASASVEATYVGGSQAYSKSLHKDL